MSAGFYAMLLTGGKQCHRLTLIKVERKCPFRGKFEESLSQLECVPVPPGCSSTSPEPCAHFPKWSIASCHSQSMCPKNLDRKDAVGPAATTFKSISAGGTFDV